MRAFLYIDNDNLGEVNFSIIDQSMGVIGGELIANDNYKKYQPNSQQHFQKQGIANLDNLNFRIVLQDNTALKPKGGIGVTDSAGFNEIYVEAAGLDLSCINQHSNE